MNLKLVKDFGLLGLGQYVPKIAQILILPLITPFLTKVDYGVYGLVFSYVTFLEAFFTLGLLVNLGNSFYKSPYQYKWLWRQLYGFLVLWSPVFCLVLGGVIYFAIPLAALGDRWPIIALIIIPYLIFGPTAEIGNTHCVYTKNYKVISGLAIFTGLLNIGLTYVFIAHYQMGYMGWFLALGIVAMVTRFFWFMYLHFKAKFTPILNFKKHTIRKALKVGLPIIPHINGGYLLSQSDRILMSWLNISIGQIGAYNASYSLANILETVNSSFMTIFQPITYSFLKQEDFKAARDVFFVAQAVYFLVVLLFACYAKEIVSFVFRNEEFKDIYPLTVLIIMAFATKPMYAASVLPFFYSEKTKIVAKYTLIAGVINVALNYIFIPVWGIYGAAITTLLAYMFLNFSRLFLPQFSVFFKENMYPLLWVVLYVGIIVLGYVICLQSFEARVVSSLVLIVSSAALFQRYKMLLTKIKLP